MLSKHSYSNVETQNFPGKVPRTSRFKGGEAHCYCVVQVVEASKNIKIILQHKLLMYVDLLKYDVISRCPKSLSHVKIFYALE